ncbi:MAG: hypothetical protein VZQ95_07945, partial [Erysipelotrichaceae bacterium]|nr:hypothetical protein [Erysipelotrichaceae bacterium]
MRVVVDIPDEYYKALKNCRDDALLADSLLIKYGEPLFDVISKSPLQGMTENEMALMLASVAVDMQDKDVDDMLDKIRAEIENLPIAFMRAGEIQKGAL